MTESPDLEPSHTSRTVEPVDDPSKLDIKLRINTSGKDILLSPEFKKKITKLSEIPTIHRNHIKHDESLQGFFILVEFKLTPWTKEEGLICTTTLLIDGINMRDTLAFGENQPFVLRYGQVQTFEFLLQY